MVLDGDLVCFCLLNDWLTGKSVEGNGIILDWTDDSVVTIPRLPSNVEYERSLDGVGAKWSSDSERATRVS